MTEGAPDYADRLMGVRMWRVSGGRLFSLFVSPLPWRPGERMVATCLHYPPRDHPAPQMGCTCGIHAHFREPNNLREPKGILKSRWLYLNCVWGVVECAGRVIRCERQFKAERGRIAALIDVPWREDTAMYAKLYDVPLVPAGEADALMAEHGVVLKTESEEGVA